MATKESKDTKFFKIFLYISSLISHFAFPFPEKFPRSKFVNPPDVRRMDMYKLRPLKSLRNARRNVTVLVE